MKNIMKNYYAPTPAKWRKLGDALMTIGTTITAYSIYSQPAVAMIACISGTLGKVITNFFTEDTNGQV